MTELDETDALILRLLAEDGRRSYSEISEAVDLTPPAVSDRVSKLEEAGVIRGFTIDVDRSLLQEGVPVLVRVDPDAGVVESVRGALIGAEATEHVFTTADGSVVAFARTSDTAVNEWVTDVLDPEDLQSYEVELVADVEWSPAVETTGFALECAECGNTVTAEGVSSRVDGELKHFCCDSCQSQFLQRYERFEEAA